VHRDYAERPDISADLPELARTQAMVVCSGAKSILDVAATAELLETLGIPVLGWQTATLPRFYTGSGGPPVSATVAAADDAAQVAAMHWQLTGASGLLLARPPADGLDIEALVTEAVEQVRSAGVTGQAVTPAVLAAVEKLSGGRSVDVNRRLIADNAALAGQVAVAYCALTGPAA
jgi:pseudouridine-5'-phosphate glycosidase